MGKIIKFDPRRRKNTRSWTRPEDYGVRPLGRTRRRAGSPPPMRPAASSARTARLARLAVALIVLAAIAVSLLGLD